MSGGLLLAIESSCDETGVALLRGPRQMIFPSATCQLAGFSLTFQPARLLPSNSEARAAGAAQAEETRPTIALARIAARCRRGSETHSFILPSEFHRKVIQTHWNS